MLEIHLKGTGIEKDRSKFIKKNNSWQNIDRQNTWQNIDRQNTWQFFNNSCHQLIRTPLRSIENAFVGAPCISWFTSWLWSLPLRCDIQISPFSLRFSKNYFLCIFFYLFLYLIISPFHYCATFLRSIQIIIPSISKLRIRFNFLKNLNYTCC